MTYIIDSMENLPHPEEAATRLSRRTHRADPAILQFPHTLAGRDPCLPWVPACARLVLRRRHKIHDAVMAGLVPAIHDWRHKPCRFPWMPGTRPGMTTAVRQHHLNASEHQCYEKSGWIWQKCFTRADMRRGLGEGTRWPGRSTAA